MVTTDECLELSGLSFYLNDSLQELQKASSSSFTHKIAKLELSEFDLSNVSVAATIVSFLVNHISNLKDISLKECDGPVEIILTVCLTSFTRLESVKIATSRFDQSAHSLGVGLRINPTIKRLILYSQSSVFFTLSADSARSLEQGLSGSCLETFHLEKCRFQNLSAVRSLANGLKKGKRLKNITIKCCFGANGQSLSDDEFQHLLRTPSPGLEVLDIRRMKCINRGIGALSSLLDQTKLRVLNLSYQVIDSSEFLNLSPLVGALGKTRTLESIDLGFNKLDDHDMPYLAAALSYNTSIKCLNLEGNRVTNSGVSILASRIPMMRGLVQLILRGNPFDQDGALELAESLKSNFSIHRIDLDSAMYNYEKIEYLTDLNWAGRQLILRRDHREPFCRALWPLVIERINRLAERENGRRRYAETLYILLKDGPALFPM